MRSKALALLLCAYLLSLLHLSVFPASTQMQDALFEPDATRTDQGEFIDLGADGINALLNLSACTDSDPYGTFDQTRSPFPLPLSEHQTFPLNPAHSPFDDEIEILFGLYSSQQSQLSSEDDESGSAAPEQLAVPEPSTLLLVSAGLLAIFSTLRQKSRE